MSPLVETPEPILGHHKFIQEKIEELYGLPPFLVKEEDQLDYKKALLFARYLELKKQLYELEKELLEFFPTPQRKKYSRMIR